MTVPVSVVVVSQDRKDLLARCLMGLSQQHSATFEVVVVADDASIRYLTEKGWADRVKLVRMNEQNISLARNMGIAAAAGEVIAFIDDDSVPYPTWLFYLSQPFAKSSVVASAGFTRGRNGFDFQWRAETIDSYGCSKNLPVPNDRISLFENCPERVIKTPGTNMAFRRSTLCEVQGFDPRYRFYLDESDINMRLLGIGGEIAIVPMAQVQHAFSASARRTETRVPKSLYEIGASCAVFSGVHLSPKKQAESLRRTVDAQEIRLAKMLQSGAIGPEELSFLRVTLADGIKDGKGRKPVTRKLGKAKLPFLPFIEDRPQEISVLSGRFWSRAALLDAAQAHIDMGKIPLIIELSRTALYHHRHYESIGAWVQRGGAWGKSVRSQPLFRIIATKSRYFEEIDRFGGDLGLEFERRGT